MVIVYNKPEIKHGFVTQKIINLIECQEYLINLLGIIRIQTSKEKLIDFLVIEK